MHPNVVKSEIVIWNGSGRAQHVAFTIDKEFKSTLPSSMTTAARYKEERIKNVKIMKSLFTRGFSISEKLPKYDIDDFMGLIGEMVLEEFCKRNGSELLFVKWMVSGTSKSRGIDLVTRRFTRKWTLILLEGKHLHAAVKDKSKEECYAEISSRFRDGLAEFDHEGTIFNLSNIIAKIGQSIKVSRALGKVDSKIIHIRDFLLTRLKNEDYSLEVVTCIDSKYCDFVTLTKSTQHIARPVDIGSHDACLTLLEAERLEELSEKLGEDYVY